MRSQGAAPTGGFGLGFERLVQYLVSFFLSVTLSFYLNLKTISGWGGKYQGHDSIPQSSPQLPSLEQTFFDECWSTAITLSSLDQPLQHVLRLCWHLMRLGRGPCYQYCCNTWWALSTSLLINWCEDVSEHTTNSHGHDSLFTSKMMTTIVMQFNQNQLVNLLLNKHSLNHGFHSRSDFNGPAWKCPSGGQGGEKQTCEGGVKGNFMLLLWAWWEFLHYEASLRLPSSFPRKSHKSMGKFSPLRSLCAAVWGLWLGTKRGTKIVKF